MGRLKPKKIISAVTALAMLAVTAVSRHFALPISADEPEISSENSISGVDSRVMTSSLELLDDDFNHATVDWEISGAKSEAVTGLDRLPYSVYEGSRSLLLTSTSTGREKKIVLKKSSSLLENTEKLTYYSATVWCPEGTENASLTLSIEAKSGKSTTSAGISGKGWQTVFFELAGSGLSGKARSLTLTLSAEFDGEFYCLLDMCGGTESGSALLGARYMAPAITAVGCAMSESKGIYSISLNGIGQYIEAANPYVTDFSGGTGIRVSFKNSSNCRSLTLYYTTLSSPEYSERLSVTEAVPKGDGTVSVTFPIPSSYIGKFRIEFNGYASGEAELLSISPAVCHVAAPTVGSINECEIERNKRSILIKGNVSDEYSELYSDSPVYLYSLEPWEEISSITTGRTAIAETLLTGNGFTFSVPISESRDELYKKYAVMIYHSGQLVRIGSPISVTNPEILAENTASFSSGSIKGSYPIENSPVLDGISYTAVEVLFSDLLDVGEGEAMLYRSGNSSFSFSREYVSALDKKMQDYRQLGINVIFILRAGYSDDASVGSLIEHPSSSGGESAAFNTVTADGVAVIRGVASFLAERYSSLGGITSNACGYTVGIGINNSADSYNMGDVSLDRLIRAYAAAFRLVYTAVRSVSPEASVYLPLTSDWDSNMTVGQTSAFDAKTTLLVFAERISEGGDLEWKLSFDPYSGKDRLFWEESTEKELSENAENVSVSNIEVLTDFMNREKLLFDGTSRNIILLEGEPHSPADSNEYIRLSADYACCYLKLSGREFSHITAFIPAHPVNYENTLKYIDTNLFSESTGYVSELVGGDIFEKLVSSASSGTGRYVSETKLLSAVPSSVKGESVLFGFSENTSGWKPLSNCISLKSGTSLGERSSLLSVRFSAADTETYRGIDNRFEKPLDLSAAEYIGFDLQAAVLPEGTDEIEVTLVIWSGQSFISSSGIIKAGQWSTVVADISGFSRASSCDRISILIKGANGKDVGEPTVLIGDIRVMSLKHSGEVLESVMRPNGDDQKEKTVSVLTVSAVGGLLLLAGGIELSRIYKRKRQNSGE